ncbi:MAG: two-component regulator propeller domain-containing protein [Saprospiraceae bacterium]
MLKSLFFIALCPVLAWSQPLGDLKFERISEGISNLAVGPILEDRQGFLWFGTDEGLNRYDGYGFRVFKRVSGDSTSLNSNIITGLYETRDGKIWVCTYHGFSIFDPLKEQFSQITLSDGQFGNCVYEDAAGLLWLGTADGLFSYSRTKGQFHKITTHEFGTVTAISGGKNGLLWISTYNGFFRYDPKTGQHKHYFLPKGSHAPIATEVTKIAAEDTQGRLWLVSWEAGAHLFDPETERFQSYFNTGKEGYTLPSNITTGAAIAPDGQVWIACGGLAVLDPKSGHISIYNHSPDDAFSLPGNYTRDVYCDKQGILWVGTHQGIAKFDSRTFFFESCHLQNPENDIRSTEFWAMHTDRDGELWAGNFNSIFRIDLQNGQMENVTQAVTGNPKRGCYPILEDDDGTLWIFSAGTVFKVRKGKSENSPLQRKNKSTSRLTVEKISLAPYSSNAWEIVPIGKHEFWIASTDGGIYRFDKETGITTQFLPDSALHGIQRAPVQCLEALPDGSFLAGIRDVGLVRFVPRDGSFQKIEMSLPHIPITNLRSIFYDNGGLIWIGTHTEGLIQTDLALKSFRHFTEKDGLPSSCILQILPDNAGRLWIRSKGGLILFNPANKSFTSFGSDAGLRNPNALDEMCRDRSGRFYIGELGYVQMFDPAKAMPSTQEFPVYVTVMKEGTNALKPENWANGLHFLYHQNYISFEFTALNYAKPGETAYAYYLEGLNRQWQSVGDKRFVTFAGLQPGHYRFRVRAAGKDGIWRECEQAISFDISGPFWRAWWFLAVCSMTLASLIYYFYKLKINRLRAEIAIRNSIAQDLHDDVGSTLSGVNVFSTLALQKLKTQPEAVAPLLEQISQKTTAMSESMSDIVWSINPKNDSVQDLVVHMKEYAAEMLEPREISYNFRVDKKLLSQKLPLGLRKELYLIFKEAINNLSKYSECQTAKFSIVLSHKQLDMIITDDGKGFDETTVRLGNGLANLRARAAKLGGQMEIISKIGIGTTLRCTLPLP